MIKINLFFEEFKFCIQTPRALEAELDNHSALNFESINSCQIFISTTLISNHVEKTPKADFLYPGVPSTWLLGTEPFCAGTILVPGYGTCYVPVLFSFQ